MKKKFNEKTALFLTKFGGSMTFFWIILLWYGGWILYNMIAPTTLKIDGQWFPLLLFISNLIQLMFMPLLQVGQNLINKNSEKRDENEYKMIKEIEKLTEKIEKMVIKQNELETKILDEIKKINFEH